MAYTTTARLTGGSALSWEIVKGADADTTLNIAHGLGVIPKLVTIHPLATSEAQIDANRLAACAIDLAATDATNIAVIGSADAGSATARFLVCVHLPIK